MHIVDNWIQHNDTQCEYCSLLFCSCKWNEINTYVLHILEIRYTLYNRVAFFITSTSKCVNLMETNYVRATSFHFRQYQLKSIRVVCTVHLVLSLTDDWCDIQFKINYIYWLRFHWEKVNIAKPLSECHLEMLEK